MKKKFISVVLFFLLTKIAFSQNILENYDFEIHDTCPRFGMMQSTNVLQDWYPVNFRGSITPATPDFFHECAGEWYGTEKNNFGTQIPKNGKGYVGLHLSNSKSEYLQTKLPFRLMTGESYSIGIYVSRAERSLYVLDRIEVFLSGDSTFRKRETNVLTLKKGGFISQTENWIYLDCTFTAKGGERFLTLGNFSGSAQVKKMASTTEREPFVTAYYFFDKAHLTPLSKEEKERVGFLKKEIKDCVLFFPFNEFKTSVSENKRFKSIIDTLKKNIGLKVIVEGHSDKVGEEDYNLKLSNKRAEFVKDILIQEGISPDRISIKALGSSHPLNEGGSDIKNRRVCLRIIKG